MTEERATYDAGTPGPIDPTNHDRLLNIYWSALRDENDGIVYGSGLLAVARAVCPEHHAVFDTRSHVAVPVADLRVALDWHGAAPEPVEVKNRIRSLLPAEPEAEERWFIPGQFRTIQEFVDATFVDENEASR